jgi:hypothetical protein
VLEQLSGEDETDKAEHERRGGLESA